MTGFGVANPAFGGASISAAGDGSGYDEPDAASFRSSGVAKSFDADGDDVYGSAGTFFFGLGGDANVNGQPFARHSASPPDWVTGVSAGADFNSVAEYSTYSPIDDPTVEPAADVADWSRSAIGLATRGGAGTWSEILTFTIDASAPAVFRLGVMAGNESNDDGRWDPAGLRLSVDGGGAVEVTDLPVIDTSTVGMVFFDVATDGTGGSFSLEGQQRLDGQGPSIAGLTFDDPNAGILAGYDFDDGAGNATTAVTVGSPRVIASSFTTGAGLNDFISNNANGLAEATDAEGAEFGTANPISFGGAQSDFGFTDMDNADDLETAVGNGDYMAFTVSPNGNYVLNLSRFTFRTRANQADNSAERWALFSSVDGFEGEAWIATGETTDIGSWSGDSNRVVVDLSDARFQALSGPVTFRLYIHGGDSNSGSATLFDKVLLMGTTGEGDPPVIDYFVVAHTETDGTAKVAWSVTDATSVSLLDASGLPVDGVSGAQGTADVSYDPGDSFTLVADRDGVERTASRDAPDSPAAAGVVTFTFSEATGVGDAGGVVNRRDPSDVIKVGDTWHVWYSRMTGGVTSGYDATVWHATSTNSGHDWVEQGEAVARGGEGEFDEVSVFTPNILHHDGTYYLYYTGITDADGDGGIGDDETAIGVATSDSPYGPWTKPAGNPVLEVSADATRFDSFRIDDSCMAVRGGKVWLYYKGRGVGLSSTETKMGVAVGETGLGPFVRQNDGDPVQPGGHEVQIWVDENEGVYSMVNGVGPSDLTHTIQVAADGLNFFKYADISVTEPSAPGLFRRELTDSSAGGRPDWGIRMVSSSGSRYLGRYEIDIPVPMVTFDFDAVTGVGPETGIYRRDPSDVIKVGDTWHVWYSKPEGAANGPSTIWHATSTNAGMDWVEQGMAVPRGTDSWDSDSAFTPNILLHGGTYYLYYTGVGPDYWTTSGYVEEQKFRIGVAYSDSPYGPWTKHDGNPILVPSGDTTKFDSFRVDDSCLAVRDGKIWLYHKGRPWGLGATETKMGVVIADDPLGPFVRQNDGDPVQLGGHEVQIWMDRHQGVYSLVGSVGPDELTHTIQYASDGMDFRFYADVSTSDPSAPGMYRSELTDPSAGGMPEWGMHGVSSLGRFAVDFNESMLTRIVLDPGTIVEGNRVGDVVGALSVTNGADHAFEMLPILNPDAFVVSGAEVSAGTVFDTSISSGLGLFVRASSDDATVDGYFDVEVLAADGLRKWRLDQFGAAVLAQPDLEATVWGDDANPDGDAFANRSEFTADTLPMDAGSFLRIESFASDGGLVEMSWSGGVEATQYLESSPTLDAGDWTVEASYPPPTPVSNFWSGVAEPEGDARFYRIRVER